MMSTKTKNDKTSKEVLGELSQQLGLVLMTAAVTFGMLEMPEHSTKVIVPNQPAFALAHENGGGDGANNTLRREREETGPHYISYSVAQRTPGRHGRY